MDINATLNFDLIAIEQEDTVHVLLEMTAPELPGARRRDPANLQIVLDRSGSMGDGSLASALGAIDSLLGRLAPEDRLGLVLFDDNVHVPIPAGPVGDGNQIRHVLRQIGPGGTTDLSAGLLRGIQEANRASNGRGSTLVLLSDGHANRGIVDHDRLGEVAAGAYRGGIASSTIGIGLGYDEDLLAAIARGGQGNAHFAEQGDTAGAQLASEVDGLLEQSIQAASLTARPSPQVTQVRLFNDVPVSQLPDGFMAELGGFYSGESRRLVLEIDVPAMSTLGPVSACELELRYVEVETMEQKVARLPVNVNVVPGDEAAGRVANPEVETELTFQRAQRAKDEATKRLQQGDVAGAEEHYDLAVDAISAVPESASADVRAEALEEMELLTDLRDRAGSESMRVAKQARADHHMKMRKRGRRRGPER